METCENELSDSARIFAHFSTFASETREELYRKMIIIDWTSRQYGQQKPIPEIIDLDTNHALASHIEFYGMTPLEGDRRDEMGEDRY